MKIPLSLRIEENLLKTLQERAKKEGDSVNGFVEKLFGYYFFANKYVLKERVEKYYKDEHLAGANVLFYPMVYVITNGINFLVVDNYNSIPIEKGDYIFACSVENAVTSIKQITLT